MLVAHCWTREADGFVRLSPLARVMFYGVLGWAIEITFTAVVDHVELGPDHLKLIGYSYLWMFPIWGIAFYAAELEAKAMEKRNVPFYLRWLLYMTTAWGFEYCTGYLLRTFTGHCPWDYSRAAASIHGLIRLDYGVCWITTPGPPILTLCLSKPPE